MTNVALKLIKSCKICQIVTPKLSDFLNLCILGIAGSNGLTLRVVTDLDMKSPLLDNELAKFADPPLIETATSVQFDPIRAPLDSMLGLAWQEVFRNKYPLPPGQAGPIEPQFEFFDERLSPLSDVAYRRNPPAIRLLMYSESRHWLVQLQNGRLVFNWRKLDRDDYPHWDKTFSEFTDAYTNFKQFVASHNLGAIKPNQWEVTYVNHLVRGCDWNDSGEWADWFPGLIGETTHATANGLRYDKGFYAISMEIEPQLGRLHVVAEPGFHRLQEQTNELLVIRLTARGSVKDNSDERLTEGLNLGRCAIVRTFEQISSEQAHAHWRKI